MGSHVGDDRGAVSMQLLYLETASPVAPVEEHFDVFGQHVPGAVEVRPQAPIGSMPIPGRCDGSKFSDTDWGYLLRPAIVCNLTVHVYSGTHRKT